MSEEIETDAFMFNDPENNPHLRAVYRYPSSGKYHLIRMEQPQPEIDRKSLCGGPERIPIDRVERLSLWSIPNPLCCQTCWMLDAKSKGKEQNERPT